MTTALQQAQSISRSEATREQRIKALKRRREAERHDEMRVVSLTMENSPAWAWGCDRCKFGVIASVEYTSSPLPLYHARPLLAEAGLIRFCDCQAGRLAREHAAIEWRKIKDNDYTAFMRRQLEAWVESHNTPTVHAEVAA